MIAKEQLARTEAAARAAATFYAKNITVGPGVQGMLAAAFMRGAAWMGKHIAQEIVEARGERGTGRNVD